MRREWSCSILGREVANRDWWVKVKGVWFPSVSQLLISHTGEMWENFFTLITSWANEAGFVNYTQYNFEDFQFKYTAILKKGCLKKGQKYTQQSRKVIWVSGYQWILITQIHKWIHPNCYASSLKWRGYVPDEHIMKLKDFQLNRQLNKRTAFNWRIGHIVCRINSITEIAIRQKCCHKSEKLKKWKENK